MMASVNRLTPLMYLLIAAWAWPAGLRAQSSTPDTLALAGCYTLSYSGATRGFDAGEYERRVWLTTTPLQPQRGVQLPRFVLRPAPGERASTFEVSYWTARLDGRSAVLAWTEGLYGVTMALAVDSAKPQVLKGEARTYTDVLGVPAQTARVTATRFDCLGLAGHIDRNPRIAAATVLRLLVGGHSSHVRSGRWDRWAGTVIAVKRHGPTEGEALQP
jgi:hypothetical protein